MGGLRTLQTPLLEGARRFCPGAEALQEKLSRGRVPWESKARARDRKQAVEQGRESNFEGFEFRHDKTSDQRLVTHQRGNWSCCFCFLAATAPHERSQSMATPPMFEHKRHCFSCLQYVLEWTHLRRKSLLKISKIIIVGLLLSTTGVVTLKGGFLGKG